MALSRPRTSRWPAPTSAFSPAMDFKQAATRASALLGAAQDMTLKQTEFTPKGMIWRFENAAERVELRLEPRMYPDGRVVIDAVNDLTILLTMQRFKLSGEALAEPQSIELPYSLWFGEAFM